jgi:hypothetical protein
VTVTITVQIKLPGGDEAKDIVVKDEPGWGINDPQIWQMMQIQTGKKETADDQVECTLSLAVGSWRGQKYYRLWPDLCRYDPQFQRGGQDARRRLR